MKKKKVVAVMMACMVSLMAVCGSKEVSTTEASTTQVQPQETLATVEISAEEETQSTTVVEEAIPDDVFIPNGFIEEKLQKNDFESYEEVIGYLEAGQAYAYVDVLGSDEPVLLITEGTYDNLDGNSAVTITANVYIKEENGVSCSSIIASEGTAYPLAVKDGLLYAAGNHMVEADCISQETNALMVKEYIHESFDENGTAHYTGFIRTSNQVYEDGQEIDDADSEHKFEELMQDYADAEVISFTVIE